MPEKPKTYFESELDRIYSDNALLRPEQYIQVRQSKAFMEKCYSDRVELNDLAKSGVYVSLSLRQNVSAGVRFNTQSLFKRFTYFKGQGPDKKRFIYHPGLFRNWL